MAGLPEFNLPMERPVPSLTFSKTTNMDIDRFGKNINPNFTCRRWQITG